MPLRPPGSPPAAAEIGLGVARTAALREAQARGWTYEDTERWLTDYPLPAAFMWNAARAYPRYTLKKGYGFWLRHAGQYYPALRGLFALCHEVLAGLRPNVDPMPTGEQLAALATQRAKDGELPLLPEDMLQTTPGTPHPGENAPTLAEAAESF